MTVDTALAADGQGAACWLTIVKTTAYALNAHTANISAYTIAPATGAITLVGNGVAATNRRGPDGHRREPGRRVPLHAQRRGSVDHELAHQRRRNAGHDDHVHGYPRHGGRHRREVTTRVPLPR